MALHCKVWAEGEHLVGAELVAEDTCCALGDAESFAMPLKYCCDARGVVETCSNPAMANVAVFGTGAAPADFHYRTALDCAAQCLAYQLATQAMANDRNVLVDSEADQCALFIDPRQGIIHTHWAAHEAQT